jgi:hypothetical protein
MAVEGILTPLVGDLALTGGAYSAASGRGKGKASCKTRYAELNGGVVKVLWGF